jgi:hypothetical protein
MLNTSHSYQQAMDKLNTLIQTGTAGATNVINHVMNNQPTDRIIKGAALDFTADHQRKAITIHVPNANGPETHTIHRNALGQMATNASIPMKFLDSLQEDSSEWGRELLAHNFRTIYGQRHKAERRLVRSVGTDVRGFLSDSYRRLDSRPIVEAFASAVQAKGASPYQGYVTDTKISLQAIMPKVYEPIPGEVVAVGISLENSDFGNGALALRSYLLRIWCTNLAITQDTLRQVHLGQRLADDMTYSQRTYELDTRTTVSAMKDVVARQLNAGELDQRMEMIRTAGGQQVTAETVKTQLKKLLLKGEADKAIDAFNSPDVYNMPAGNTVWRMSNAISWIANSVEDTERKLELMKIAGEVLPKGRAA